MTPEQFENKYLGKEKVFYGKEIKEDILSIEFNDGYRFTYIDDIGVLHLGEVSFSKNAIKIFKTIFIDNKDSAIKDDSLYKLAMENVDVIVPVGVEMKIPETIKDKLFYIAQNIGEENVLCMLAEECSELSQAALKYRRAVLNITPLSTNEALDNLVEEIADVELLILQTKLLFQDTNIDERIEKIKEFKSTRFWNRIFVDKNADS